MATLYRSYRPQNFAEIVNQNHIKITLEHEIKSGRIAHAYLFCGPRGIGKTTVARVFAKAVNCTQRKEDEYEPCNACATCKDINDNRDMDIIEIDAASQTGVDNVRDNIIGATRTSPSRAKFKVFIIDEVHMLSIPAFNALLKILEEPPLNVIFILCTTEAHKIPATIISRCQRFDFKRISAADIVKKLQHIARQEKIEIDKDVLEAIARQSEGHMRDAESLLGQVVVIGGGKITRKEADLVIPRSDLGEAIAVIKALINKDAGSGIGIVNRLLDDGVDLKRFTDDLVELLRKIMLVKINPALSEKLGLDLGEQLELGLNDVSQLANLPDTIRYIERFLRARIELKNCFIMQLPLEIAIADLCTSSAVPVKQAASMQAPKSPSATASQPAVKQDFSIQKPNSKMSAPIQTVSDSLPQPTRLVTKEEILAKWNEVLIYIKKHNHSLTFILRVCEPRDINNNVLLLAFKYKFHKDRIDDFNIKCIVENVLREVYGQPIKIEAIVDDALLVENLAQYGGNGDAPVSETTVDTASVEEKKPSQEGNGNMIDNLLKTFGGKVVG